MWEGKTPAPRLLKNALFRSSSDEGGEKQVPEPAAKRAVDHGEITVSSRVEKSIFKRIHVGSHVLEGTWRMSAGWSLGEIWQAASRRTAKAGSWGQ